MDKYGKREFLDFMIREVSQIPVESIVGAVVDLVPHGQYMWGLCPFHPDTRMGSFVVTPQRGLWRCFTEDIGGTGIKFEMLYYELPFLDAVFKLAIEYGIITDDEFRAYSRKRYDRDMVSHYERKTTIQREEAVKKAAPVVLHAVYNAIPRVCPLTKAHRDHLLHERGLTEADLADYFSFPATRRFDLAGKVLALLEKKTREATQNGWKNDPDRFMERVRNELPFVPGFYRDRESGKACFMSARGIGFLVRNAQGKPVGIQVRRDKVKPGESRYVWFSSLFANGTPEYEGGASPGAPGGVILPQPGKRPPAVCITEGRFKAEQIAKKGNAAIYVSGVSTWRNILPELDALLKSPCRGQKRVLLMFDADMMGNVAVHAQLSALAEAVRKRGLAPRIVTWRIADGKGFDDLVLAHPDDYASRLISVNYAQFEALYEKELKTALVKEGVTKVRDIPEKRREAFTKLFQERVEAALSGSTRIRKDSPSSVGWR